MNNLIPIERVENRIYMIRGQKVMLDRDLAKLYDVKAFRLREQVKRNIDRFPDDFMFQLEETEVDIMVSQNAIPSKKHLGGYFPYVFTQEGVAMLSTVLRSRKAVQVNIAIMRAFVRLNRILVSHVEVSKKLKELEQAVLENKKDIQSVFTAIRKLMAVEVKPKRKIGFIR